MTTSNGEWSDKYNPFNSIKAVAHVQYWQSIKQGIIPPPFFLSIDPSGICNYSCPFCNASHTLQSNPAQLSIDDINDIMDLLKFWRTRAVCVGGGGEPLTNPHTGYLIDLLTHNGIDIGVVTNGSAIDRFMDPLSLCKWVGVSMNAGTADTHAKAMGCKPEDFDKVLKNIRSLVSYRKKHKTNVEVTYKYLIHPLNYKEIYEAARIAKEIGCDLIHIRPGDDPWFNKGANEFALTPAQISESRALIDSARTKLEDSSFKVYGVSHKFDADWRPKKSFKNCYATLVQCLISSSAQIELCCDRRGYQGLILCSVRDARDKWGGDKHKKMVEEIDVNQCPRCTYTHVNEIFENVVLDDRMLYDFI
jgi:MoaA/NifB/PqqE/SkfB family radical SAM enzyme